MFELALRCVWIIALTASSARTTTDRLRAQTDKNELARQVDDYLTRVESAGGLDAAVIVIKEGEIIVRQGYGMADDSSNKPFSADTAVGIASISKQFAAAAIMRLVDEDRLSIQDTLGDLLPNVPDDKAAITLHQLLTHTAGLQADHMKSDLEPLSKAEALARIYTMPLLSKPGERYDYSNSGYTLLVTVVEAVSDQPYDTFLRATFFDPLGMTHTGVWGDERFDALPAATGYFNREAHAPVNELPGAYWTVAGNGDIISVVDDMLTWYRALAGGEVLSAASTGALFTSYTTDDGADIEYGYGWEVREIDGVGLRISHNGGGITGNSILSDYRDHDLQIIILGNRITYNLLGGLPLIVGLPADETSEALAENIVSGNFAPLPSTTFTIWPYLAVALIVLGLVVAALAHVFSRRRFHTRPGR